MPTPHYYFCCLGPAAEPDDDKKRLGYVSLLGQEKVWPCYHCRSLKKIDFLLASAAEWATPCNQLRCTPAPLPVLD